MTIPAEGLSDAPENNSDASHNTPVADDATETIDNPLENSPDSDSPVSEPAEETGDEVPSEPAATREPTVSDTPKESDKDKPEEPKKPKSKDVRPNRRLGIRALILGGSGGTK
jgi:outer membrane biosynthesis protein TonB